MKNNLFLIIGNNKENINFNMYNILHKLQFEENNKIIYDMLINTFTDVIDEASMVSLFSPIKVIIVNNFTLDKLNDLEIKYLEKFINNNNKDIYIILISDKIDARKKSYKLFKEHFKIIDTEVENNNIIDYVSSKIKDLNYKIDSVDIEYFVSKVGNDINNINNELEKLFIYKIDDKKIYRKDIDLLVFNNVDNVIYEFTNAILDCNNNKIKEMYNKFLIDNVSIDYLLSSVAGSIRSSIVIKILKEKNMSNSEISKVVGKKEYYVKKMLDRLYNYSINDLSSYINKLALIDRNFKIGRDSVGRFELFLFNKDS